MNQNKAITGIELLKMLQNKEIDTLLDELYIIEGPLEGFSVKFKNEHAYISMFGYHKELDSSVLINNKFEVKKGKRIEITNIQNTDKDYDLEYFINKQHSLNEDLIRAVKQLNADVQKIVRRLK